MHHHPPKASRYCKGSGTEGFGQVFVGCVLQVLALVSIACEMSRSIGGLAARCGEKLSSNKLKEQVVVKDFVTFTWEVVWSGGAEVAACELRINSALGRGVPLPEKWDVALSAMKLLKDTRGISKQDLPPEVPFIHCDMLGVPRGVSIPQASARVPGACVIVTERGCPVNYVLVAHVHEDVWICSPGGTFDGEWMSKETLWQRSSCAMKDLSNELWQNHVPKRRVRAHVLSGNLQRLMQEHQGLFNALVAEMTCEAEIRRSKMHGRQFDIEIASAMYQRNPFCWETEGRTSKIQIAFLWHWEQHGAACHSHKVVRLDHAVQGEVPRPERLITDASLHKRLLKRAERETKQNYCPCRYLGSQTAAGFEPNPALWPLQSVRRGNFQIWVEFLHVRNAVTNKPHRVQVWANNWLNRYRSPGNPLNVTASRSLRFSLEFMDAFAAEKEAGMTFAGVMYDNSERPEIVRQLPNDVDIQHEKFWWNRKCGQCICLSLLELQDAKLYQLSEGQADGYKYVCDELGYDVAGVPASEEDNLKFTEYRKNGDLGPLHERRWERDINWNKPDKESDQCWFVANAGVENQETEPKILLRSLVSLRVHLKNLRIATTSKIRTEYDSRVQRNQEAVSVLEANFKMWNHVGGLCFEYLKDPSEEALDRAHEAKECLIKLRDQPESADNTPAIASECIKAVDALASLNLETIRRDKFPLTPETLFEGLVRNLHDLKKTVDAEEKRREHWLGSMAGDVEEVVQQTHVQGQDKYGCDPDAFARPAIFKKPRSWADAVQKAGLVRSPKVLFVDRSCF
jgi:hypothetical protein